MNGFFSQGKEDIQVHKMHCTQDENDQTDLNTQFFYDSLQAIDLMGDLQCINRVAQVYQVEPNQEQVVHTVCQFFIAMKNIIQKYFTVFKQCFGNPDCQEDSYY